jgi:(R,R)-butanediol dehydrogenase/meso-butanediol dehydrogenase/diacetyl reductase
VKAVAHAGSGRFETVSVPDPTPAPGELILEVRSCGICGSDLKTAAMMPPGAVLGHEFCGVIAALGAGTSADWKVGQFVASMPLRSCGRCRWCLTGEVAHCETVDYTGLGGTPGAFAEFVKVSGALTFGLPAELGPVGALVEPLAVGLHAVAAADLAPSSSVLVLGGGTVGSAVTLWARRMGAGAITVSDPVPERRQAAIEAGATDARDPSDGPYSTVFDVVFECVGGSGMAQLANDAATTRGRVIVAGVCTAPDETQPIVALMKEIDVRHVVYYSKAEFDLAARLLASGAIDPAPFISGSTDLDGFDSTFAGLSSGHLRGKHLVQPAMRSSLT